MENKSENRVLQINLLEKKIMKMLRYKVNTVGYVEHRKKKR